METPDVVREFIGLVRRRRQRRTRLMSTGWKTHTLSVLVEDKPGVLARVARAWAATGEPATVPLDECASRSRNIA